MHSLAYKVKTLSPVIMTGRGGDANLTETTDYLTGSSILGIFAGQYIQAKGLNKVNWEGGENGADQPSRPNKAHEDETFYRWFMQGGLCFNPAYPVVLRKNKENVVYPTPFAIQTDKGEKQIINLIMDEMDNQDLQTRPIGGYASFSNDIILHYFPPRFLNFHHFKNDRLKRKGAVDGIFNYESLAPGQEFAGQITGFKEDLQNFKQLFGSLVSAQLGKSKTAQYGQVTIELMQIQRINPAYDWDELDDQEIIITLIAPVILINQYGFPEVSLPVLTKYLEDALGQNRFTINKCFLKTEPIENYVSVWQLKKPLAAALGSGSTISLKFQDTITGDLEQNLHKLFLRGLGERTNEGYGQMLVNWATSEEYIKPRPDRKISDQPSCAPPEIIKQIFTTIVKKDIDKHVQNEAFKEAKNFNCWSLTTSTIGRLELMLKEANSAEEFIGKINLLKDTAKTKLESCRGNGTTLYQVLTKKTKPELKNIFNALNQYEGLANVAAWDYQNDQSFKNQLYQCYWLTFLKALRKNIKMGVQ